MGGHGRGGMDGVAVLPPEQHPLNAQRCYSALPTSTPFAHFAQRTSSLTSSSNHSSHRSTTTTTTASFEDHAAAAALVELQTWAKLSSPNLDSSHAVTVNPPRLRSNTVPINHSSPYLVLRKPLASNLNSPVAGRPAVNSSSSPSRSFHTSLPVVPPSPHNPEQESASVADIEKTHFGFTDLQRFRSGVTSSLPTSDPLSPPHTIRSNVSVRRSVTPPIPLDFSPPASTRPSSYQRESNQQHLSVLSVSDLGGLLNQSRPISELVDDETTMSAQNGQPGFATGPGRATPVSEEPPALSILVPKKTSPSKGGKLSSFFGWKSARPPSLDSPTTPFAEDAVSPAATAQSSYFPAVGSFSRGMLTPLDVTRANVPQSQFMGSSPRLLPLPTPPGSSNQVAELEQELREISQELAQSVKREMELEDELERLKAEKGSAPMTLEAERRGSDYYSDSGAGSVRYQLGDGESRIEELESLQRKTEQDRAQMKLEMSKRLEESMRQKRLAEERLREVEDIIRAPAAGDSDKVRELEVALEEARRKANEERQFRESYESLIAGMRLEVEKIRHERDNLAEEIVPQLRSKIEGLEQEATAMQSVSYENSRMQQELEDIRLHGIRAEEEDAASPLPLSPVLPGFTRSKSSATRRGAGPRSRSNSVLSRSGSLRDSGLVRSSSVRKEALVSNESRDELAQRVKELQEQRDALHSTVKSLILRHNHMEQTHAKRMKKLQTNNDSAAIPAPRRTAYQNEVRNLRDEITNLRRRADDALNQKWQCEKGLSGLKMDLDRAQAETTSLRQLLKQRSHSITSETSLDSQSSIPSLTKAYNELRTTQVYSLASLAQMDQDRLNPDSHEINKTLDLLKQSISEAEAERDHAIKQADQYRTDALKLQKSELEHLSRESALATDLYASTQRMDSLAAEVQSQMQSNTSLRARLTNAISRGEKEQEESTVRIRELQDQLKDLEDRLVNAQQHSEDAVAEHEEEVRTIKAAQSSQLQRTVPKSLSPYPNPASSFNATATNQNTPNNFLASPALNTINGSPMPPTPMSPCFASGRSPRLDRTTSGKGMSMHEASRTGTLEARVRELESKLQEAEGEMQEVVGRMNRAQIEVAELQAERDEALMRTKRLQVAMQAERERVKEMVSTSALTWPDDY